MENSTEINKMQDNIKKCCYLIIAICNFVLTTCKTTLNLNIGYWEYVPTTIISVMLFFAMRSETIAKTITKTQVILNDISRQDFIDLNQKVNDIVAMQSELCSQTDNDEIRSIVSRYKSVPQFILPNSSAVRIEPEPQERTIKKLPDPPQKFETTYVPNGYVLTFDTPRI